MRPKKIRHVQCDSSLRHFKPFHHKKLIDCEDIALTLDEFEAIRLLDYEGLSQTSVARMMKVHRSTVSRIITSARQKVSKALVEIQSLKIEGGCCQHIKGD